jgi:ribonuclease MRP protein subunit RMP1
MASKPTPRIPTLESLVPIQQLLHLAFHRNKNQHRVATWWSSLSQLRRQVTKLIALLEVPGVKTKAEKLAIEKQVEFLREQIVPRCYM